MKEEKILSAVNIMIKTDRMHRHLLDSGLSDIGLHRTQHRVLMHIARHEKLLSQKSLAEHIGITPAAITGLLKKLQCEGYIERIQGDDNRYNEVKVTELGKRVVEDSFKIFSALDTSLFEGFSDSELDGYINCLQKIQENIRKKLEKTEENTSEKMV